MRWRIIVLTCLVFPACASAINDLTGPTPYRTEFDLLGSWHGTRAELLEGQIYTIKTTVNEHTPLSAMTEYNLLKSAEIATEQGFSHFVVEADEAQYVKRYFQKVSALDSEREVGRSYSSEVIIKLVNEPADDMEALAAVEILAELGQKHLR